MDALEGMGIIWGSSCLLRANLGEGHSWESSATNTLGNERFALKGDPGDFLRDFIFEIGLPLEIFLTLKCA